MRVLEVHGLWKAYAVWTGGARTLRGALAGRTPLIRPRRRPRRWALRDVSFSLDGGHSIGLVGHNGAGKSTLLRLVSGLGRPTRGSLQAHGDTASLLNLGTSFDLQLTGRENAYTAALVSGFTRARARAALPGMLEFSELGEYLDSPVRTYSEGMKLRLAFSIVAALNPRLLVLDEVLAVGDAGFRAKCAARLAELRADGTSLVVASHASEEILENCERAVWIQHGIVRALGDAESVVRDYEQAFHDAALAGTPVGASSDGGLELGANRFGTQEARISDVSVGSALTGAGRLRTGDGLSVSLSIRSETPLSNPVFSVTIRRSGDDTPLVDLASDAAAFSAGSGLRSATVELRVERLDLPAGEYVADVGLYNRDWERTYDYHHGVYTFHVQGPTGGKGLLVPPHAWARTD